jgi:MoxR-like ATPase
MKLNLVETMSISELRKAIPIIGKSLTPVIISEPGVGKTSLLNMLEEDLGTTEYDYIYVDCPVKDMSDIGMVIPNHETKTLEYYVAGLFKLGNGKKKVICLDELMKAPKLLQIIFTRMMLERMVGDVPLPKGSIIFATSNNATDGVGDSMLAHAGNRVCKIEMAKPSPKEWLLWASETGIHRSNRSCVAMHPNWLASYRSGDQDENTVIFNPKRAGNQFVSPRS